MDLLRQSGYAARRPKSRRETREQLVRAWWVLAQSHQSANVALIGDEMQCLSSYEYSWLIDLTNDLQALGVRVISILFGQPELASLRSVLRETHRGDILGRFMSRLFAFEGIASASELQQVLSCYDDTLHGGGVPADLRVVFQSIFSAAGVRTRLEASVLRRTVLGPVQDTGQHPPNGKAEYARCHEIEPRHGMGGRRRAICLDALWRLRPPGVRHFRPGMERGHPKHWIPGQPGPHLSP